MKFSDFKKNIEKFRECEGKGGANQLTKDQKEFIMLCRSGENKVSYKKMVELWAELKWGKIGMSTLAGYYQVLIADKKK